MNESEKIKLLKDNKELQFDKGKFFCGKNDCGKLKGYYPNGDTWFCDECEKKNDAVVSNDEHGG